MTNEQNLPFIPIDAGWPSNWDEGMTALQEEVSDLLQRAGLREEDIDCIIQQLAAAEMRRQLP